LFGTCANFINEKKKERKRKSLQQGERKERGEREKPSGAMACARGRRE
jgi:hypothetical protein